MQAGYLSRLKIMDSIKFLEEIIVPRLEPIQKKNTVVLHPGCATTKLQLEGSMKLVANRYAHEVVVPYAAGCCGMAGDRGFLFPELTHAATATELEEVQAVEATGYYASAKTCEMALTHHSGKPYQHLVYLVEETTR
jgi:D-lactate dehydrogenase